MLDGIAEMFAELNGYDAYEDELIARAHWLVARDREHCREWRRKNRAATRAYRAAYRAANVERVRAWDRKNQRERRKRLRATNPAWVERDKARKVADRARMKGAR